jgi:signal transduction histidine kinase
VASIRGRLTLGYAFALCVTVGAFGGALYFDRLRSSQRELDQRLGLEANLAANYLTTSREVLGRIVTQGPRPALVSQVGSYFEGVRDYQVVVDSSGLVLSANEAASRNLGYEALASLLQLAQPAPATAQFGTLDLGPPLGPVRYVAAPVFGLRSTPGAVIVASPLTDVSFSPAALLRAMLTIAPLILVASVGVGFLLARRSLRPLEGMVDELEAITDGRSLHRRVVVPLAVVELARLGGAMNRMFARLEESFDTLRRFTADASHELKTPLMVLRANVERALTHPGTPAEAIAALDEALEEVNQMAGLVDNLLTLARAGEGQVTLAREPCDLRELMAEAAETAGILGEEAGIGVRTELPDVPVRLEVDRARIRQLLLNLITNAIKFTPKGGKVSLGLVDRGNAVAMVVGDTGIGIASGDLPHIFDRFWRADVSRDRSGERPGTGLGLAITKWIAEAHGGSIAVQSRVGRGTVFTVTLPRPVPSAAESATVPAAPASVAG